MGIVGSGSEQLRLGGGSRVRSEGVRVRSEKRFSSSGSANEEEGDERVAPGVDGRR